MIWTTGRRWAARPAPAARTVPRQQRAAAAASVDGGGRRDRPRPRPEPTLESAGGSTGSRTSARYGTTPPRRRPRPWLPGRRRDRPRRPLLLGVEDPEDVRRASSTSSSQVYQRVTASHPRMASPSAVAIARERPAHREQAQPHPTLHRPQRRTGPLGDLGLAQAAEVGELHAPRAGHRAAPPGRRDGPRRVGQRLRRRRRSERVPASAGASGSGSSEVGRRRRTASMARWWTMAAARSSRCLDQRRSDRHAAMRRGRRPGGRPPRGRGVAGYPCCQSESHAAIPIVECLDGRGVQGRDASR